MKLIQVHASTQEPLYNVMENARTAVSTVCGGIDDMHLLGNKALVIRAEIYPEKLSKLYEALTLVGIKVSLRSLPDRSSLEKKIEHPLTLQITSFSDMADGRVTIPKVPG